MKRYIFNFPQRNFIVLKYKTEKKNRFIKNVTQESEPEWLENSLSHHGTRVRISSWSICQ